MRFPVLDDLTLPASAVTQTFGFFGRKGSGKTYAAGVWVESLLANDVQVVVLDPVGNWYGLRLANNGRSKSRFDVPVLGGERGDIPLEVTGGALVAQTIVDTGTSAVLDVSSFRKADRKRFMADFAEELFHRKKSRRTAMHLVIEEAQLFAPQMSKGEERMLGAIEDLVRLGRNYGIGASMISQRPQSVNTEVRNQCEPLVVFQLVAKHERDAVKGWMQHMGVDADLEQLSKLKTGECFFWSPAWLEKFVLTRFKSKVTYDASSTPTVGGRKSAPAKLKPLKLDKLSEAMRATVERAKADDPKELRAEIARLNKELANAVVASRRQVTGKGPATKDVDVAAVARERDRHWEPIRKNAERTINDLQTRLTKIMGLATLEERTVSLPRPTAAVIRTVQSVHNPLHQRHSNRHSAAQTAVPSGVKETSDKYAEKNSGLSRRLQGFLDAAATLATLGVEVRRNTVCAWLGLHPRGGSVGELIKALADAGMIELNRGQITVTDAGLQAAEMIDPAEAIDRAKSGLTPRQVNFFDSIVAAYPNAITRQAIAEQFGIHPRGGSFGQDLARLVGRGLVEGGGGEYRARDFLFAG
jgi:hypothetical protein